MRTRQSELGVGLHTQYKKQIDIVSLMARILSLTSLERLSQEDSTVRSKVRQLSSQEDAAAIHRQAMS